MTAERLRAAERSLTALNKVALNKDTVLVFVPARTSETADDQTNAAVLAAQQTLTRNKIVAGLYTLPANSPDYSGISAQVAAPALLVLSKGGGMVPVTGEVTEAKLLQAFMACSAGGCGPGGGR